MQTSTKMILAVVGVAIAAVVIYLATGSSVKPVQAKGAGSDDDRVRKLQKEMAQLKARLAFLSARTHRNSTALSQKATGAGEKTKAKDPDGSDQRPYRPKKQWQPGEKEAVVVAHLETKLYREEIDEEWSRNTESSVEDLFRQHSLLGNTSLHDVECRSTFCRADLSWPDTEAREAVVELLPRRIKLFQTSGFMYIEHPDATRATFFFSRKGHKIPRPRL